MSQGGGGGGGDLLGELRHGEGAVLLVSAGGEGGEADHEEVQAREGDQVHCQLAQVAVQLPCAPTAPPPQLPSASPASLSFHVGCLALLHAVPCVRPSQGCADDIWGSQQLVALVSEVGKNAEPLRSTTWWPVDRCHGTASQGSHLRGVRVAEDITGSAAPQKVRLRLHRA